MLRVHFLVAVYRERILRHDAVGHGHQRPAAKATLGVRERIRARGGMQQAMARDGCQRRRQREENAQAQGAVAQRLDLSSWATTGLATSPPPRTVAPMTIAALTRTMFLMMY